MEPDPLRKRPAQDPATPEILRKPAAGPRPDEPEVGEFRQGSPLSQLALGRYLVGRALTESVGRALLIIAVGLLALAAVGEWLLHSTALLALFVILTFGVLVLRWILLTLVRRLTGFSQYAPIEERMQALVADTRSDVLRELRRNGLPGHTITLPLLALRLFSRARRAETLQRLHGFETERAVPRARLDELHLLLRQAFGGRLQP